MFPIHDDTQRIHGRPFLNYGLLAVNAAVFVWQIMNDPSCIIGCQDPVPINRYGSIPYIIFNDPANGVPTIFTSMFMHSGSLHIIGNMVFLWIFGDNIEDKFGRIKYLLIYLGWGVVANLAFSAFAISTPSPDDDNIPAVGASGAISGVLGSYLVMFPRAKIFTIIFAFFITTIRIPALAYIPFWFILQVIPAVIGAQSNVAYLAHIAGFVSGVATGFAYRILPENMKIQRTPGMTNTMVRKERPKLEDAAPPAAPEVIEGSDFYEVIAEVRGVSDASQINASYEPETKRLRIATEGPRRSEMYAKLPEGANNPKVEYIRYLNGIARIRLAK